MSLAPAQLGQLPYMQLGARPGNQVIEPAWHKALTAFLVNTAANTGKDLVGNALAKDYTDQAVAAGVPGVKPGQQAFLDKLLHGPQVDKEGLREGVRGVTEAKRYAQQDQRYQDQLSLEQEKLKETIAARGEDRASREQIATENAALRKQQMEQQYLAQWNASQDRRENTIARMQEMEANRKRLDPLTAAQTAYYLAQAQASANPGAKAGAVEAAKNAETIKLINSISGKQPVDNSQSVVPQNTGPTPTVPGGKPVSAQEMQDLMQYIRKSGPQSTPVPMPDVQTSVGSQTSPNMAPSAGTSQQMGQSAQQSPEGSPDYEDAPLTQEQPLVQHVGTDLMSLVRPPQTPNSPTAIQPATTGANPQPVPMSPEAYRLAAEFARRMGLAPGMGGTPGQAGSGGLPLGYG